MRMPFAYTIACLGCLPAMAQGPGAAGSSGLRLQAGYALTGFEQHLGHTFAAGVCYTAYDESDTHDGPLSTIPLGGVALSAHAIGLLTDGRFYPGVRAGVEYIFIILAARAELGFAGGYVFVTPSLGLNLLSRGNLMLGYNLGLNDGNKKGFQLSLNVNFGNL